MELHPLVTGFSDVADAYERGRPGYPAAAVELIGLPAGAKVVDVGAGTGKLTRALVGFGLEVVAVEPIDGMRERLARELPEVRAVAGTAEALPVDDASVDGVVSGEAFHWFDPDRAPREMARVLRPDGVLAILFNTPLTEVRAPWGDALSRLLTTVRPSHPGHLVDPVSRRRAFDANGLFTPLAVTQLPNVVRIDREGVLAHVASLSYVGVLAPPEREALLERVDALLRRHGVEGEIALTLTTRVLTARRRAT
jgi:SAM-dependent methyltransferase